MITLCEEKDTFQALFAGVTVLKKNNCGHCASFCLKQYKRKSYFLFWMNYSFNPPSNLRFPIQIVCYNNVHILLCRNAASLLEPRSLFHGVISHSSIRLSLYVYNRALNLYFTSSRLHHLLSVTMFSSIHHAEYFTQDAAKCDRCI